MAPLELSRRDLLQALLGLPVLLAAEGCGGLGRRARTLGFDGAIAGGPDRLGHRLRDGARPDEAQALRSRAQVVIVGGGAAGLSAAWRLERAGLRDFQVLELDDAAGGTARAGENSVSRFPWGAHYLPCPLPHARAALALLEEMGVCQRDPAGQWQFDEAQLCRAPQERLFFGDRFYEGIYPHPGASAEDRRQHREFQRQMAAWAEWRDGRGRRAFAVPMACGSDDAEVTALDRLSMAEWMEARGLSSPRLRWYVEYATRDDFGTRLEHVSAWAALHYFAARHEGGRTQEVLTWPEGNGRLVSHLAKVVGRRLQTGVVVLEVRAGEGGRGATVVALRAADGAVLSIEAEQVVVAAPRGFAARLCPRLRALRPDEASQFQTSPWLVANLTLDGAPAERGFPLAWDNVLHGSRSLGYVVATHQLDPGGCAPAPGDPCSRRAPRLDPAGPPGRGAPSVWTWYLPLCDADPAAARRQLLALSWREIADLVLADLVRAHPDLEARLRRLDAWRWGHAMVRPRPGLVWGGARQRAQEPIGDIHFAHADLSALPLFEEAQYHGVRAAEAILARRGVRFESLL